MSTLTEEINKLQFLLQSISCDLELITRSNFEDKIDSLVKKINLLKSKRKLLLSKYGREELLKFDKLLLEPAKQIQKKFDNMVEEYNIEAVEISRKLLQIENRKKLTNYFR